MLPKEVEARGGIGIVLVGRGFTRLGFDVEGAGETDLLLVIHRHVEEPGQVVQFPLHVGVPQGGVTFTAAPERVTFAAQTVRDFESLLYLRRRIGKHIRIRRSARPLVVTLVGE
jgi:hypothetical protein